MNPYDIVRRPRISEKTVHLQNKLSAYTFEVHPDANKIQIKEAIKALFKVDVVAVNTMNCRDKDRRMRNNRQPGPVKRTRSGVSDIGSQRGRQPRRLRGSRRGHPDAFSAFPRRTARLCSRHASRSHARPPRPRRRESY